MPSIKKTLPLLFTVLLSWQGKDASAQNKVSVDPWVSIGPYGGPLSELVQYPDDPRILFAMSNEYPSYLIRSMDKGRQWSILGKIPEYTQNLVIDPRNPLVLYSFAGSFCYKTDDGGLTWNSTYFENWWFSDIVVHPSGNGKLFACGTSYSGYAPVLLKSDNHGTHWERFPITARNGQGSFLAVDPLHPDTVYVAGEFWDVWQPFLYRSFDGGSTWTDVGSAFPAVVTDLAMDPVETNRIYAATYAGIFRSEDRGDTWSMNTGSETTRIAVDPNSRNILYAGQYQNILKSEDWGTTWVSVEENPDGQEIMDILVDLASSDTVFCTTSTGFFKSSNAGENWQPSNSGFAHLNISAVKVSPLCPGTLLAAVYGKDVYKTTDAAGKTASALEVSWERLPHFYTCVNISDMEFDLSNPDIYYALEGGG
jgi:photosystem II stability/assembly factor-like uncharacterized protein